MNPINNERLKMYLRAEQAVLINQSYTIEGQTYTRANLGEIREAIDDLIAAGATISPDEPPQRGRSKRVVLYD